MNLAAKKDQDLWSVVLAGGEGERLKPLVQRWLGRHKPKQYCSFIGTRSMFQHTLDRSDQIVAPERRVTIIGRDPREEASHQLSSRTRGKVILQPANRDTAAGVFLGLAHVRSNDPDATVLIFPSDHFVYPEGRFVEMTYSLARAARHLKQWVFLLGVTPDSPEPEYGWIQPGAQLGWIDGNRVHGTSSFLEKPSLEQCKWAMGSGALWNTMIIATKVETLWSLGLRCFPEMMRLLEVYGESIGSAREDLVLEGIYQVMPSRNFSAHLLQEFPERLAVMELRDVLWSDWGKPERIAETLRSIGREPRFSRAQIA
jgi:mannose-1-phosphate guanylyltransferase